MKKNYDSIILTACYIVLALSWLLLIVTIAYIMGAL